MVAQSKLLDDVVTVAAMCQVLANVSCFSGVTQEGVVLTFCPGQHIVQRLLLLTILLRSTVLAGYLQANSVRKKLDGLGKAQSFNFLNPRETIATFLATPATVTATISIGIDVQ